jgi:hypothetical protein
VTLGTIGGGGACGGCGTDGVVTGGVVTGGVVTGGTVTVGTVNDGTVIGGGGNGGRSAPAEAVQPAASSAAIKGTWTIRRRTRDLVVRAKRSA